MLAMSGGVDSSVSAALLAEDGFEIVGIMLNLWSEYGKDEYNRCCTPDSVFQAKKIAVQLGFPFFVIDVKKLFYEIIVNDFISGYTNNITPNPCLLCNNKIRWGFLLDYAISIGADYLATGHYAQKNIDQDNRFQLLRGIDTHKDQSYVLYTLGQEQLAKTLFPIGRLTKLQVRELARQLNLPVSERPDSQDLCFLGGEDYRTFLLRQTEKINKSGPIISTDGKILGYHNGLAFYTIGQRKGLNISTPYPTYVIEKDSLNNTLIVGDKNQLAKMELIASNLSWVSGEPPAGQFDAQVKIRYKARDINALVILQTKGTAKIVFSEPAYGITPGQSVVFYNNMICLGGGIIQ